MKVFTQAKKQFFWTKLLQNQSPNRLFLIADVNMAGVIFAFGTKIGLRSAKNSSVARGGVGGAIAPHWPVNQNAE